MESRMEIFEVRKNMQNHSMELSTGLDGRVYFMGSVVTDRIYDQRPAIMNAVSEMRYRHSAYV
jgi:hypothetical protein